MDNTADSIVLFVLVVSDMVELLLVLIYRVTLVFALCLDLYRYVYEEVFFYEEKGFIEYNSSKDSDFFGDFRGGSFGSLGCFK